MGHSDGGRFQPIKRKLTGEVARKRKKTAPHSRRSGVGPEVKTKGLQESEGVAKDSEG